MLNLLPAIEDLAAYQKAARDGDIISIIMFNVLLLTIVFSVVLIVGMVLYFVAPELLDTIVNHVIYFIGGVKL